MLIFEASISSEKVRGIIATRLGDEDVESAIATAEAAFKAIISPRAHSMSRHLQSEILRWLAAHFLSIKDPSSRPSSEKIGELSVEYTAAQKNSNGILGTIYGQQAAILDPTKGLLGAMGVTPKMASLNFS